MVRTKGHKPSRPGFNLVELLVVILILAILGALGAAATMKFIAIQQETNTKTTLRKVNEILQKQWLYVAEKAYKESIPDSIQGPLLDLAGRSANPQIPRFRDRARVIYVKLRLRQEFPMTFEEARNPWPAFFVSGSPQDLARKKVYEQALQGVVSNGRWWEESSVCLLLALSQSRGGMNLSPDELGPDVVVPYRNPDGSATSAFMIVDGYGRAVAFNRWPAYNDDIYTQAPPTGPGYEFNLSDPKDPTDPEGLLSNIAWATSALGTQFVNMQVGSSYVFHPLATPPPPGIGPPRQYRLFPIITSAGASKAPPGVDPFGFGPIPGTGFFMNVPPANVDQANDNIYSHRLRESD